jgi:hypothetical protein
VSIAPSSICIHVAVARKLLAFTWDIAPRYLRWDRDGSYEEKFSEAARWLGFREVLTAPQSPWQNASYVYSK